MLSLFIISLIWAFSFGFTKGLSVLDPNFIAFVRLSLSLPLFIPFFQTKGVNRHVCVRLCIIGAVEYGLFYCLYGLSYRYLAAYEVALFTVFIPLYITLINDFYHRRFRVANFLTALMAALGAVIIVIKPGVNLDIHNLMTGFLLMQVGSLCFGYGQIEYKRLRTQYPDIEDHKVFALLYAGAIPVTAVALWWSDGWHTFGELTMSQWAVLVYLGVIASGICFFWWNKASVKVHGSTLAVFNNIKIPLAVAVSIIFFHEKADLVRLLTGGGIIVGALCLSEYVNRKADISD